MVSSLEVVEENLLSYFEVVQFNSPRAIRGEGGAVLEVQLAPSTFFSPLFPVELLYNGVFHVLPSVRLDRGVIGIA